MLPDMASVATGLALSFKMRGEPRVAMTYFGEGSTANGQWHEAMNFAGIHRLPVVFLLENNKYAYSTPSELEFAADPVERAAGYGFPGVPVDGNDVETVFEATRIAAERARRGEGPTLIECHTMRMHGHGAHDDMSYVPKELVEKWAARDPIARLREPAGRRARLRRGRDRCDPRRGGGRGRRGRTPGARAADARPGHRDSTECSRTSGSRSATATPRGRTGGTRRLPGRDQREGVMSEMTYLEAISDGLREEMRRDDTVFCLGEDIGVFGGAFKVTAGFHEEFGARPRARHAAGREPDHRRRRGRGRGGHAARLRDAVRRLHRVRVRPARERRGQAALPPGRGGADGRAAADRRRLLRRAVPLAEPGGLVPAGAGAEGGRARDRRGRERPAGERDPRPEPGRVPRAQAPVPAGEGRGADGQHTVPIGKAQRGPRGRRAVDLRLRLDGRHRRAGCRRAGRGRRDRRPAHALPARPEDDPGQRAQDRQGPDRARGDTLVRRRRRGRGADRRGGVRGPRCARAAG